MIYLDNNATTSPLDEVCFAIREALEIGPSNPSSAHQAGNTARRMISLARESVANLIGAKSDNIYFTSSGTESNNWILHSQTRRKRARIVVSTIEHESIRKKCQLLEDEGCSVFEAPVDSSGVILMDEINELITPDTSLVSVQWVNNETGVIQPIESIAKICSLRGVRFHSDAAQAVGKIPIAISDVPVDFISLTGHKFHAPMGIGALYCKVGSNLAPLLGGGMQESGLRSGTENLLGIVGMGKAAELRTKRIGKILKHLFILRDIFESQILKECDGTIVNGTSAKRVCNTSNILFHGIDGQALVAQLNAQGVYCSQSSACTAQLPEPSHVLTSMGLSSEEAYSSIRFSLSELNTLNEVERAVKIISNACSQLKAVITRIVV